MNLCTFQPKKTLKYRIISPTPPNSGEISQLFGKNVLKKALLSFLTWSLFAGFCAVIAALSGTYLYLNPSLPNVEALKEIELQIPLRIFSADGKLIGQFGEKRRDPITFEETPEILIDAILSAEDDEFYSHKGVDIKGLLRAVSQLALSGSIQSGGSTITMQVARNFFLSRNQTFSRKFNEILLAIKIEQELSKQEILSLYLNKIYLGNRAYGFKAAAQVYYGKPLDELSLAQAAMVAGLPKAPSTFNPIANPSRALVRRDWILGRMLSLGKITPEQHQNAVSEPVTAIYHGQKLDLYAPYASEMARNEIVELLGEKAYTGGYNIVTTIDSRLQAAGQDAVIEGLLAYSQRHGYRGPEQTLDRSLLQPLPATSTTSDATETISQTNRAVTKASQLGEVNLLPWIEIIKKIPTYGGLQPAVVIDIKEKSFTALLGSSKTISVDWENGLNKGGAYVNENFHSPHPKTADKVVELGDVVRVFQKAADNEDKTLQWHLSQIPKIQGALTALNPKDGAIKTIIGGFDFHHTSFNRASQAKRLPGSNFKPFVYSIALNNGLSAASVFNDAPIVVEDASLENNWRPENSSGKFYGPTRLRKALYLSRNLISIRLLRSMGIDALLKDINSFGIQSENLPKDLSIALGTHVMTPLQIATGYSVFANNGYKVEPFIIKEITNSHGEVIFKTKPYVVVPDNEQDQTEPDSTTALLLGVPITKNQQTDIRPAPRVVDERVTFIMNSILGDVIKRGTAKKAQVLNRSDLKGKTGTTNGPTDAWFSGYNHHLVATAWVGFDNNSKIGRREFGGTAALPIWINFMKTALEDIPEQEGSQPDGIVTLRIDPDTGEPTSPNNPKGIDEMFLEENAPKAFVQATVPSTTQETVKVEEIF